VGQNRQAASCSTKRRLGETARARLDCLRQTEDGFVIAEEDLRLRGAGELLGERQSGLPAFRLANLPAHSELIAAARDDCAVDPRPRSGPEVAARRGAEGLALPL